MDGRVLALMSALCFGINPIVLKAGLDKASSTVAVMIGLLSGLPLLILMAPVLGGFQLERLTPAAAVYFLLGGIFGVVLGRAALYLSIKRLGSSRASTFKNGAPVVTALLATIFLSEVVDADRWAGILLVTIGLTLIGGQIRKLGEGPVSANAIGIAALAPLFYGIRPIFSKLGLNLASLPLAATLLSYVAAVVIYLAYFAWRGNFGQMRVGRRAATLFAAAGLLQVLGLLLLNFALERADVSRIYPISASAPFVTFVLSYTVLRNLEQLKVWDFIGTAAVVGGVIWLLS